MGKSDEAILVTADQWYAGGRRILYHPDPARVLPEEAAATPGALRVFERVVGAWAHGRRSWPCS
ncbi:hypothetical protein ACXC9Q_11195 [Kribbella sp. CWNU-51]